MQELPYRTRDLKSIRQAVKEDSHPVSLIAVELNLITPGMDSVESIRLARLLVELASGS